MTTFQTENYNAEDNFQRVEDAIKLWVQHGVRFEDVTWHRDPNTMFSPIDKARVTLTMTSTVASGCDEVRRSYDQNTTVQTVGQVGIRIVTVQMLVESFDTHLSAHTITERLRLKAQAARLNYSTELRNENISINDMTAATNLPTSYDTRVISACACNLIFNVAAVVLDAPEDWIEQVNATGEPTT